MVKFFPCSGCFTACTSAQFPVEKLGYAYRMTHCGMVPNGVAKSIKLQLTSLPGIEMLACSFLILTSTTAYFDINLCNKGDGKCNDPSIC